MSRCRTAAKKSIESLPKTRNQSANVLLQMSKSVDALPVVNPEMQINQDDTILQSLGKKGQTMFSSSFSFSK